MSTNKFLLFSSLLLLDVLVLPPASAQPSPVDDVSNQTSIPMCLLIIHGIFDIIGYGILLPIATILPILEIFPRLNSERLLNLHMTCRLLAYYIFCLFGGFIGVTHQLHQKRFFGGAHPAHAYVGVLLLILATLQIIMSFLYWRKKSSKENIDNDSIYWSVFHRCVIDYSIVGLGIYNIIGGLKIIGAAKWIVNVHISFISIWACVFVILHVWRCVVGCRTRADVHSVF